MDLAESELDMPVDRRDVDRTELYAADEVFLTGTASEIAPIRSYDGRPIGAGKAGPITRDLIKRFAAYVRAQRPVLQEVASGR